MEVASDALGCVFRRSRVPVIFALIAIPILILVAKVVGLALIGGAIALIVLGIWKLFDLVVPQYRLLILCG